MFRASNTSSKRCDWMSRDISYVNQKSPTRTKLNSVHRSKKCHSDCIKQSTCPPHEMEEIKHFSQLWYHFFYFFYIFYKRPHKIMGTFTSAINWPQPADLTWLMPSREVSNTEVELMASREAKLWESRLRDFENLPLIWCCFGYIYIYIYI